MGLKYIIPSRYTKGSASQNQEQMVAREEDEQARTRSRAEAILERRAQEAMAAEDRTAVEETEGAAAVRRLFERRHAEVAEAILERIARDMSAAAAAPSQP